MELWKRLTNYTKEVYPMHMPGHKGGRYRLFNNLYALDVTEVPETDHLYNAEGILKESMAYMAQFYGTKKSIYLVNGSTVGIHSAIGGVTSKGDEVLIARNCHHSVYNALTIYDLIPNYIYPMMTQWGLIGGIDPTVLATTLAKNPKIVAFIMTSPTYDGFLSDIEAIQKICSRYNVILIIDEAHGAHLPMSNQLPLSAVEIGADIVIHSMHKTLPTLTGSGIMHMNLSQELERKVLDCLQRHQTSSPSYVMMAQMETCVKQLGKVEEVWKRLLDDIEYVEKKSKSLKRLYMLKEYENKNEGVYAKDPLKSIILTKHTNINGQLLMKRMRYEHNIQMEMGSWMYVLGIITIADNKKALKHYIGALKRIDRSLKNKAETKQSYGIMKSVPRTMTPYEVIDYPTEMVEVRESVNRISAGMITPYPPGIPGVVAGETLTDAMVSQIIKWEEIGIEILGLEQGCISVIKA